MRLARETVFRSRSLWDSTIGLPDGDAAQETLRRTAGPDGAVLLALERGVAFGPAESRKGFVLGVAIDQSEIRALSAGFQRGCAAWPAARAVLSCRGFPANELWLAPAHSALRRQLARLHGGEYRPCSRALPREVDGLATDLNSLFARQRDMLQKARERAGTLAMASKRH